VAKLIAVPYNTVTFLGHLAAVGVTANHFGNLKPIIPAIVSAGNDGLQDATYIFRNSPAAPPASLPAKAAEKSGDHDHGSIPEVILKAILSPLLFLSAGWNFLASQLNKNTTQEKTKPVLNFKTALKQSFGIEDQPAYDSAGVVEPVASPAWLIQEVAMRFAKEEKRLEDARIDRDLAAQKKIVIIALKEHIITNLDPNQKQENAPGTNIRGFLASKKINNERSYSEVLTSSRSGFFKSKSSATTHTNQFVEKMSARYEKRFVR
jgi:hypothetical protein